MRAWLNAFLTAAAIVVVVAAVMGAIIASAALLRSLPTFVGIGVIVLAAILICTLVLHEEDDR